MQGKKSFLLYIDIIHTVEKLSDDKAGKLFKHMLKYVNDQNPTTEDPVIDIAFEPIKQSLKRDLKSWKETCEKNRENANIRWNKKSPSASERIRTNTKHTDIDSDIDSDKDISKKNCLFKNANIQFGQFHARLDTDEFKGIDLQYYFNEIMDWSSSNGKMKKDWIATARNWIRRSIKDGNPKRLENKRRPAC